MKLAFAWLLLISSQFAEARYQNQTETPPANSLCKVAYLQSIDSKALTDQEKALIQQDAIVILNAKKNILVVNPNVAEYLIKLTIRPHSDYHHTSIRFPLAFMDISRARDDQLMFADQEIGKARRNLKKAYSLKSFSLAIQRALNQVTCNDLKDEYRKYLGYEKNDPRDWLYQKHQ